MKVTKRARRLEKYLSGIGWETNSEMFSCSCGEKYFSRRNFCSACGKKMKKTPDNDDRVFNELEAAIAYALGEKK
jgi:uncharacterized OB-fold protein